MHKANVFNFFKRAFKKKVMTHKNDISIRILMGPFNLQISHNI